MLGVAMRELPRGCPGSLHFLPCDLAELGGLPAVISDIRKEFGPIFGLVNNAGVGTSGVLAMTGDAEIERLVRINTVSPIILTKYAVRSMMAHGGGRVVNIASVAANAGYG